MSSENVRKDLPGLESESRRTAAIVQARMGSSRFPGKSLAPIWKGKTLLEMTLIRLKQSSELDGIVLATSTLARDDALVDLAESLGVAAFRGDEQDVLGRFYAALESHPADAVLRVCADNPLVDAAQIDKLVRFFWESQPCDYACNDRMDCGLPDGAGAEIMSAACLRRLDAKVQGALREHVSMYVTLHSDEFRVARLVASDELHRPEIRLDVDYSEDAEFIRRLIDCLPQEDSPAWTTEQIIEAIDRNPEIMKLRRQKQSVAQARSV